jgi:flagellar biosynthesis chaperone FliJ
MFSKYKLVSSSNYSSFNRVVNLIDTMYHNSKKRTIKDLLYKCHEKYSTGNYNNTDAIYIVIGEIYYCMVNSKNISQNMYKKLFSLYSLSNPYIYKNVSIPVEDMISMISIFDKICEIVNFNTPIIHYIRNSVKISRIKTRVFDIINEKNEYIIEYYGAYTNTFESTRYYINHERLRYDYKCVNVIVYDNINADFVLFTLQDNTWTPTFTNETANKIEKYKPLFDSPERRLQKYTDLRTSTESMYDILNDILNTKLPACTNKLTELENDLKPLEKTLKKLKYKLKYNTGILKVPLIPKSQKTNIQAKISTLTKSIADTQKSINQHKSDINTTQEFITNLNTNINIYRKNTNNLENILQSMRTRQNTKINLPQRLIVQCTVYQKQ